MRCESYPRNVLSVGEWQGVGFVTARSRSANCRELSGNEDCRILYEIENSDPVSYRREQMSAIWVKQEVASTVDRSKKV